MTQSSSDPSTPRSADPQDTPATDGPSTALVNLGRHLAAAREAKGLSREALASQLNMGLEQLQALESGERNRLPETVFIVAQARRVASHLQVNIDDLIQALRRALPAQGGPASSNAPRPAARTGSTKAAAPLSHPASRPSQPANAPRTGVQAPPPPAPASGSALASIARALAWLALLAGLGTLAGLGWNRWQQTQRQLRESPAPSAPAAVPSPSGPAAAQPAQPATAAAAPADQLVLTVPNGPSWLSVETLEGESLFRGELAARRSFPIGSGLRVLAGRPDLVQVQQPGGTAPEPMGTIEDVRVRTYEPATAPNPPAEPNPPATEAQTP